MAPTRREALALGAAAGGALLAGCGQQSDDSGPVYGFYLHNKAEQEITVTVEALDGDGKTLFREDEQVDFQESTSFGEFETEPTEVHAVARYSEYDGGPHEITETYEAPEEECSRRISNSVVIRTSGLSYETMCNDY